MTPEESIAVVRRYYQAYQAEDAAAVTSALEAVLDTAFSLESPLVAARFGGAVTGPAALPVAASAAPFLKQVNIDELYATPTGGGVVALIHFPSPAGVIT